MLADAARLAGARRLRVFVRGRPCRLQCDEWLLGVLVTPPKPPRDDDRITPPAGVPRVKTDPHGMRIPPIIERERRREIERDRQTPKHGAIVQQSTWDDITGHHEGEDLAMARARRPTPERIARLEAKHDSLDEKVDRIDVAVAGIAGQMQIIPDLIGSLRDELKAKREDDHVVLTTKLDIGKHEAKTRIDTQQIATTSKWKMAVRIISGLFSAGVLGAAIAFAASRC